MDDTAALLEPQIPSLRRYALGLVRDHAAADDLVQDTLERAVAHWYLRRDGDLRAWLFAILRNLFLGDLRRNRRRGAHIRLEDVGLGDVAGGNVVELGTRPAQERGLEVRDVLTALDLLPEEHRSILLLVGVEDMSYQEVARILDIPPGTVMSRLARARQRLRAILETGGGDAQRRGQWKGEK